LGAAPRDRAHRCPARGTSSRSMRSPYCRAGRTAPTRWGTASRLDWLG